MNSNKNHKNNCDWKKSFLIKRNPKFISIQNPKRFESNDIFVSETSWYDPHIYNVIGV